MYYVYILYRSDAVTPFYVGMGRGKRMHQHEQRAKPGRSYKDNIICEMVGRGIEVPKVKVAQGLTRPQAFDLEISLIRAIGRAPHGPLTNGTAGGDGRMDATISAANREAARGNFPDRPMHPAVRARMSELRRGIPKSAEHRRKIALAHQGMKHSDATRTKMSDAARRRPIDPIKIQRMAAKNRGGKIPAEVIAKRIATRRRNAAQAALDGN